MNREIAKSLLEQELANARELGYRTLVNHVDAEPLTREIVGQDGKRYQLEVCIFWDSKENGAIRIIAAIDDGGRRALAPLSTSDIVYPD